MKPKRERLKEYKAAGWSREDALAWADVGELRTAEQWIADGVDVEVAQRWRRTQPTIGLASSTLPITPDAGLHTYRMWRALLMDLTPPQICASAETLSHLVGRLMVEHRIEVGIAADTYGVYLWDGLDACGLDGWNLDLILDRDPRRSTSVAMSGTFCRDQRLDRRRPILWTIYAYEKLGITGSRELARWTTMVEPRTTHGCSTLCMNPEFMQDMMELGFTSETWSEWMHYGFLSRYAEGMPEMPFIQYDFLSTANIIEYLVPPAVEMMKHGFTPEIAISTLRNVRIRGVE